jgi:hypothetical protein
MDKLFVGSGFNLQTSRNGDLLAGLTKIPPLLGERAGVRASFLQLNGSSLILGSFAMGRHLDQLRIELAQHGHEVLLGGHDFVDVLIDHWHFIESRRD